jgi:arginase
VAREAAAHLTRSDLDGVWIHLDCDVLDDAVMPAVDYRIPDGLHWHELEAVLGTAVATGAVVGVEVTIYNPALDPGGTIARALVACLTDVLTAAAWNDHGYRARGAW